MSDVALLGGLGVTDIGENRDQEAAPKAAETAGLDCRRRWHFIGQLQVNKAAAWSGTRTWCTRWTGRGWSRCSGTRAEARDGLSPAWSRSTWTSPGRRRPARPRRRGPADVPALADAIAARWPPGRRLVLGGVMAVAPLGAPPRPAFPRLAEVAASQRPAPGRTVISAGMTGDLEEAIAEGATHVRVGTALLGGRRAFVR